MHRKPVKLSPSLCQRSCGLTWEPSEAWFTGSAFSGCQASLTHVPTQGELRISVLPAYLSYDAPWPVRKIPLRCTAHYVAYHVESKVCPNSARDPWGWGGLWLLTPSSPQGVRRRHQHQHTLHARSTHDGRGEGV